MKHELTEYIDTIKSKTYRGIWYHYDYHHVFDDEDCFEINNDAGQIHIEDMSENHLFLRFIMLDLKFEHTADDMFGK